MENSNCKIHKMVLLLLIIIAVQLLAIFWATYNKKEHVDNERGKEKHTEKKLNEILNEGRNENSTKKSAWSGIIEENINTKDRDVRWKNAEGIYIVKILELGNERNKNPQTNEEMAVHIPGKMEIIKEIKQINGLKKELNKLNQSVIVKFIKMGGNKPYLDDIILEKDKTYMVYTSYDRNTDEMSFLYLQEGVRELKPVKRKIVEELQIIENDGKRKIKSEEGIYLKNNETNKYENINDVI